MSPPKLPSGEAEHCISPTWSTIKNFSHIERGAETRTTKKVTKVHNNFFFFVFNTLQFIFKELILQVESDKINYYNFFFPYSIKSSRIMLPQNMTVGVQDMPPWNMSSLWYIEFWAVDTCKPANIERGFLCAPLLHKVYMLINLFIFLLLKCVLLQRYQLKTQKGRGKNILPPLQAQC